MIGHLVDGLYPVGVGGAGKEADGNQYRGKTNPHVHGKPSIRPDDAWHA
jgi:hypothetical protein